jgi:hypothetical protein
MRGAFGPPGRPGDMTHQQHAMAPGLLGQTIERAEDPPSITAAASRFQPITPCCGYLQGCLIVVVSDEYSVADDPPSGRSMDGELESAAMALCPVPVALFVTAHGQLAPNLAQPALSRARAAAYHCRGVSEQPANSSRPPHALAEPASAVDILR